MINRRLAASVLALWIGLLAPAPAAADDAIAPAGQPSGAAQMAPGPQAGERPLELERQKMRSRFRYLMLGYGLIWVSLGVYLIQMNQRVSRVGQEIGELRARLDDLKAAGRRPER